MSSGAFDDPEVTCVLSTASGAQLRFGSPDANSFLKPLTLDSSSLQDLGGSQWMETRPNGFRLYYGELPVPESTQDAPPESPSIGGECPDLERSLGYQRNILPPSFSVPFVGVPVAVRATEGQSGQPVLCAVDELDDPHPLYSTDGSSALDRATELAKRLCRGFVLPLGISGNNLGRPDVTCQVNFTSGNLNLSIKLPLAGPADPPIRLCYNSRSEEASEIGFGWSTLFSSHVKPASGGRRYLNLIESPAGDQWSIVRSSIDGPVSYIQDPFGRQTTVTYPSTSEVVITDTGGRETKFLLDGAGDLVRITFADDSYLSLQYDADHQLTHWEDPEGNHTQFTYQCNLIASLTTPELETTRFTYSTDSVRSVIDARGHATTLTLGSTGDIATATQSSAAGAVTTTFSWGPLQRLLSVVDANSHSTTFQYVLMADRSGRLAKVIEPPGESQFVWDTSSGQFLATVDPVGNRSTLTWDSANNLLAFKDAEEHTWPRQYNSHGQLTSLFDPLGHSNQWDYDLVGRQRVSIDGLGHRTTLSYDSQSRIHTVIDPLGIPTTYSHDAMNRLISTEIDGGAITTLTYDLNGLPTAKIDPLGHSWQTQYDGNGRRILELDPVGNPTSYTYDPVSNLTAITQPGGAVTTSIYDPAYRKIAVIDPLGHTTTSVYDPAGNPVRVISPLGHVTTNIYDAGNRKTAVINPRGHATTTIYDSGSRPVAVINPLGHRTTTIYDRTNHVIAVVGPNSQTTTKTYDPAGRTVQIVKPLARTTTTIYDDANRPVVVINPLGHRTTTSYDSADRPVQVIQPRGNITTSLYDSAGNKVRVIDPMLRTTTSIYDPAGRRVSVINPLGHATTTVYDDAGRPRTVLDPLGFSTTYTFDGSGKQVQAENAEGGIWTTTFNAAGKPSQRIDPRGEGATLSYDADQRLILEEWTDGQRFTYTHDPAGNRVSAHSAAGLFTFSYDACDRVQSVVEPGGKIITYAYDQAGQRVLMEACGIGRFTYTYDDAGRQTLILSPASGVTTVAFDAADQIVRQEMPGSTITTIAYDPSGNPLGISHSGASGLISRLNYSYNLADQRTGLVEADGTCTTWTYDEADQLLTEHRVGGPTGTNLSVTRAYDPAGNATLKDCGSITTTFAYSPANRLTHSTATTSSDTIVTTFTSDAAGNRTGKLPSTGTAVTLTWDAPGRLAVTALAGVVTTVVYDTDGNRTAAVAAGVSTGFIYDADHLLHETIGAGGAIARTYISQNLGATHDIVGMAGETVQLYEASGNTQTLLNVNGQIAARFKYDAFGHLTAAAIENATWATLTTDQWGDLSLVGWTNLAIDWSDLPTAFSTPMLTDGRRAGYMDFRTGLCLVGGRFYDPTIGRFISEFQSQSPAGPYNLFTYRRNDPVNRPVAGDGIQQD